ncbi:MAG: DUF1573 domain-containing protein [Thermoanaerobaculia bacterium]|nr:MAG: DUF1573 domain-containing protein [Thermoanaerobaculia bacterium]
MGRSPCAATAAAPRGGGRRAGGPDAVRRGREGSRRPAVDKAVIDAGPVARGEKIRVEFALANRGEAPLEIRAVQPACGCTVASFDRTVAPGATGKVEAVVDTTAFSGAISKSLTVLSNDPVHPRLLLTVQAEVRAHLLSEPSYVRFVHTRTLPAPTAGVTVFSPDHADLAVIAVESTLPYVIANVREASAAERVAGGTGAQWRVEATLDAEAPIGPLRDFLLVRTNHPQQAELQVPLSGVVRPVLHLTPSAAQFGELSLAGQARRMVLTLINFGADPVEVRGVAASVEGVTARIEVVEEGKRWRVVVELAPTLPRGRLEGELKIATSSASMPELVAPLSARID